MGLPVKELPPFLKCKMPKTIPLRAALCVKRDHVVIDHLWGFVDNSLLKGATPKKGRVYEIQRETSLYISYCVIPSHDRLTLVRRAALT